MKNIAIFGSTGSIGRQTLDIIENNPDKFKTYAISGNNNYKLIINQAKKFKPKYVVITNEKYYSEVKKELSTTGIKILSGYNEILNLISDNAIDIVVMALVGYSGMLPTLKAVENNKTIALANKESLVVAGQIIMQKLKESKASLIPVDSEHSAIFQCLTGEDYNNIEKIYLTASGGPFRNYSWEQLSNVTRHQALQHPNWDMGGKITIDSATMFNKGLEMIEAKWLFNLAPSQIDVIVHPQSIIHSIVQFIDGSMKAQMGLPDMRTPIQYALTYPERIYSPFRRFSFLDYNTLNFEYPDYKVFRSLKIAIDVMNEGGNKPCILNAANEEAVYAFLNDKIKFTDIFIVVEEMLNIFDYKQITDIQQLIDCDSLVRQKAESFIEKKCK